MSDVLPTLTDPAIQVCPFTAYKRLRDEAPVYFDAASGLYEVTEYALVNAVVADPKRFSSASVRLRHRDSEGGREVERLYAEEGYPRVRTPIDTDPPEHRKMRARVDKAFNLMSVRDAEPKIAEIGAKLIDQIAPRGRFDMVSEFATPLPVAVITHLLGVSEDKMSEFRRWSDALLGIFEPNISDERLVGLTRQIIEMQQFLAGEIAAARTEIAAGAPRPGIITALVRQELEGEPIDTGWMVNMLQNLLVAGNETTTSALASCGLYLARMPNMQEALRADPEKIPLFAEEVLRLEAPLQCQFRTTTEAVEMGGVTIPEGALVAVRYAAANRDERQYERPDEVDLSRPAITQHLTFGRGTHFCLGNVLARTELRIGVELLLQRLRNIRFDGEDALARAPHFFVYGPRQLNLAFDLA